MRGADVTQEVLDDGTTVCHDGDLSSLYACEFCGKPFSPRHRMQRTCGDDVCQNRRRYQNKRASFRRSPVTQSRARARNARWSAVHRSCKKRQPWLVGPPPYYEYLPGGGVELDVRPLPRWPVELRNTRGLHGMITTMVKELAGVGHRPRWPRWTLVPWPGRFGWGVYFWEDEIVDVVADKQVEGELFARHVTISTSPRRRIRAPKVKRRGRMKVDLTTITPVTITSDGRSCPHIEATADSIRNSITREFVNRLGAEEFLERDMVRLEMLSKQTFKATVPLGGKYGQVIGWEGSCQLEVNAPALWLLKCAGLVGLGSRTAFGFGRIRVSEL